MHDAGLVAIDPAIMARGEIIGVARLHSDLAAVIMDAGHLARDDHTNMARLAAIAADHRLDAFRPAPSRLQDKPRGIHVAELDHLDMRFRRRLDLVRVVKGFLLQIRHDSLP